MRQIEIQKVRFRAQRACWRYNGKKIWVMFQVCLLTFSVYIGSAIYTSGIEVIMQEYHVSLVSATLGLTLFVAGYGLGALCIDVEIGTLHNCSRADALVATERDALYRSHAHLLIHAIPIHYPPSANSSSNEFWHAFGVPVYYRLCRITGPCNWWRYCLRHIRFQEESIRHYRLGCLRRMCPCDGTHCRRVCRSREGLEMDNMGINVVGWLHLHRSLLFLPRNLFLQHSLSLRYAPSESPWRQST